RKASRCEKSERSCTCCASVGASPPRGAVAPVVEPSVGVPVEAVPLVGAPVVVPVVGAPVVVPVAGAPVVVPVVGAPVVVVLPVVGAPVAGTPVVGGVSVVAGTRHTRPSMNASKAEISCCLLSAGAPAGAGALADSCGFW